MISILPILCLILMKGPKYPDSGFFLIMVHLLPCLLVILNQISLRSETPNHDRKSGSDSTERRHGCRFSATSYVYGSKPLPTLPVSSASESIQVTAEGWIWGGGDCGNDSQLLQWSHCDRIRDAESLLKFNTLILWTVDKGSLKRRNFIKMTNSNLIF